MTTIDIRLIRPSPNPIRKMWDEDKMQELAASIKEQGVVVPIKVRPIGNEYETVYGHRRVEAARRAGLNEIPAIIEGASAEDAIWQALVENLSNEDMSTYEKGEEIERLKQKGFSLAAQARRIGLKENVLQVWRTYYLERTSGIEIPMITGSEMIEQVVQVQRALGDDISAKQSLINKAAKENLDRHETRAVADAYKAAPTPELRDAVLNTSGKLGNADHILEVARMKVGVNNMTERHEVERRQAYEEYDQAAKDFFDFTAHALRFAKSTQNTVRYGKFSPEAARFAIRRIDSLMDELTALKEALEGVN